MLVWGQSHTNHCDWLLRVNDDFIQQTSHKTPVTVALVVKTPPANAGDVRDRDSIPASGRSPRGGHGNPLQYSCLKNPMDRGDWQATVCRAAKSWTRLKRHSMHKPGPSSASVVAQSLKNSPVMQETACSAGDLGSDPGSERSPGEGNDNPLQYSCLGNPMDRGAWWAYSPWGCQESGTTW